MAKANGTVRVESPQGVPVILAPGDDIPDWALGQVTNPAAILGEDAGGSSPAVDGEPVVAPPGDYESMTVADLRGEIKARNEGRDDDDDAKVPGDGKRRT